MRLALVISVSTMNSLSDFQLRSFNEENDLPKIGQITELLHEAYRPLAERGMRYLATHQPPEKTLERLKSGESYLAFSNNQLIGTVTLYSTKTDDLCVYYNKAGVYSFGQFAIHPSMQGHGLGSKMMDFLEQRAKENGASELALDTSERADHLIQMYSKRGYRIVDSVQWNETNYRSVIMSKVLI